MNKEDIIKRLNRIKGQIEGISKMIQDDSSCESVLQQIKAAVNALKETSKLVIVEDVGKCIENGDTQKLKNLLKEILDISENV